jgi:hypothetical protein
MRLAQMKDRQGRRVVAAVQDDGQARVVNDAWSVYALAMEAVAKGRGLARLLSERSFGEAVDLAGAYDEGRLLSPIDHPDPAHLYVTGTGLTHLGSAAGRDAMHKKLQDGETLTDSMKMFRMGLEGGKPRPGETGIQPEWFYKGDGSTVVAPGAAMPSPSFARDGGEEPEIVGVYLIGGDGAPYRVGFALGNEFSDHVTERENYLWLAHSKLRPCSFGPELLLGELPADVRGTSRIRRGRETLWEKPFISGEENMSHAMANLEQHHFKYALFRRPGDVHVHFFGTATLSFSDGVTAEPGDAFEIECTTFGLPLRNRLEIQPAPVVAVRPL